MSDEPVVEEFATMDADNPFFTDWDTPYGIPPFAAIADEHYRPAFEAGIEQQRAEVAVNPRTIQSLQPLKTRLKRCNWPALN